MSESPKPSRRPTPVAYASPAEPVAMVADVSPAGWRAAAGAAWLAGVLAAVAWAAAKLAEDQQTIGNTAAWVILNGSAGRLGSTLISSAAGVAGPVVFALAAGIVVATVLYDRRVNRVAWAAAGPVLVGCWALLPGVVAAGPNVLGVTMAVVVQSALVFAGTRVGRPVARWLARHLVPPPLRVAVVSLWV